MKHPGIIISSLQKRVKSLHEHYEERSPEFLVMIADSTTIDLSCIKFPLSLSEIKILQLKNSNLGIFIVWNDDDEDYQKTTNNFY